MDSGAVVFFLFLVAAVASPWVIRRIRKQRYFASEEFLAHKAEVARVVADHNEMAAYAAEIRANGTFQVGASSTGAHAHLATAQNTSRHRYRRDRHVPDHASANVHNCSLSVVRSAEAEPIKYVMKYFGIKADEQTLAQVQALGESTSRLADAVANLTAREEAITGSLNPPRFIVKHYRDELMSRVGADFVPIDVPYPTYVFEYVSASGNSSQKTTVTLNAETTDALIETLASKIRFRKSAAGQRALMTASLRRFIKDRDDHTCQNCGISVAAEPHLLIEVDHIIPVSKGGLSVPENLQALCWLCNRRKSNKILAA